MAERVPVAGSERPPVAGARVVGAPDPDATVDVTVTLRRRGALPADTVSRAEFAERHGADPEDIRHVEAFAAGHGLEVVESSPARRAVALRGRLADLSAAFGAELALYEDPRLGTFRGRVGTLSVPAELGDAVESVLGLDDRPAAQPHFRPAQAPAVAFTPPQLAALYDFPAGDGAGETVAIIELGGGFRTADLAAYWRQLGISPAPRVEAVGVDGAGNAPTGDPNGEDGEVMLDIEVVGGVAPAARIAVYFAPNTTRGFLDAITTAVHDSARTPSIVSISWGQAEDNWTAQARTSFDQAFQDAAALGVTVCAAAGDDGSADGIDDGQAHVDFPAASPSVLACGGTKLTASGTTISAEVVWNEPGHGATGGGVSRFFARPDYQAAADVPVQADTDRPGRGVPDIAGDADPLTGYKVRVDGVDTVIGGTSAVAPLWAGLLARVNASRGSAVGFVHPQLYAAGPLRDITSGDNGAYRAGTGWDACTGLGSPDGAEVLAALQ